MPEEEEQPKGWRCFHDMSNYTFLVPHFARENGLVYKGSNARLRSKLQKWREGGTLSIAGAGASITAGQGLVDGWQCNWLYRVRELLRGLSGRAGDGNITVANGGVPGVGTELLLLLRPAHLAPQAAPFAPPRRRRAFPGPRRAPCAVRLA